MKADYLLAVLPRTRCSIPRPVHSMSAMATLADPNGYTLTGSFLEGDDNEGPTTVKPGECFIDVKP